MSLFSVAVQFFFENSLRTIMTFSYQILVIGLKTTHFQFASHSPSSWWSDLGKKENKEMAGNEPNRAKIWVLRNFGKVGCFPKCLFFSVLLIYLDFYHFAWFASRNLNGSCCFLLREIELNSKHTIAIFLLLSNRLLTCCCVQIHQTVYNNRE